MVISTRARRPREHGDLQLGAGDEHGRTARLGIAALAITAGGRNAQPAQAAPGCSRRRRYGKPGNDLYYGHGWVNAGRLAP